MLVHTGNGRDRGIHREETCFKRTKKRKEIKEKKKI